MAQGPCDRHPELMRIIGEVQAMLRVHEKRDDEIKAMLQKIHERLRETNGAMADEAKEIAVLKEEIKRDAVTISTLRSAWITVAGLMLREGVRRVFGL